MRNSNLIKSQLLTKLNDGAVQESDLQLAQLLAQGNASIENMMIYTKIKNQLSTTDETNEN